MTHQFLTSHAVRDSQGRFTGQYKLGLNLWGWLVSIYKTERAIREWGVVPSLAPAPRKIPRAWAVVQLLILIMTLSYMGA